MRKIWMCVLIGCLLSACSEAVESADDKGAQQEIARLEEKLHTLSHDPNVQEDVLRKAQKAYAEALLAYYKAHPESKKNAAYLDKASMTYADMGDYYKSAQWADTLLNRFPKYEARQLVLESQATAYDVMIQPRDSAKVRFYYSILLNEFPDLEREKREGILQRLRFNHLGFDAYVERLIGAE